jgi:hypothetical protein
LAEPPACRWLHPNKKIVIVGLLPGRAKSSALGLRKDFLLLSDVPIVVWGKFPPTGL